jgi:hypothetical protein
MATITTRGYINKLERKEGNGKSYLKFTLATQQKRKVNGEMVTEKLYINCVDFSGKEPPGLHLDDRGGETAYVGITGYLTITGWAKNGKGGANVDVTVTEYEALEQKGGGGSAPKAAAPKAEAPPEDPFALES